MQGKTSQKDTKIINIAVYVLQLIEVGRRFLYLNRFSVNNTVPLTKNIHDIKCTYVLIVPYISFITA
jgi:hypothetical protein